MKQIIQKHGFAFAKTHLHLPVFIPAMKTVMRWNRNEVGMSYLYALRADAFFTKIP